LAKLIMGQLDKDITIEDRTLVASQHFETVGILDFLLSWSRYQPLKNFTTVYGNFLKLNEYIF